MQLSAYRLAPPFLGVKHCYKFSIAEVIQINRAFLVAWIVHAHSPDRMNGLPYITHPIEIVEMALGEFRVYDANVVIGSILHDTDEHSIIPFFNQGVRVQFGEQIADDNRLLTKTDENKPVYLDDIVGSGRWVPLLIKLFDRLHNMRTLDNSDDAFQKKQATETRKFFLPLCNKLSKIIPQKYETVPPRIYIELLKLCEKYGC